MDHYLNCISQKYIYIYIVNANILWNCIYLLVFKKWKILVRSIICLTHTKTTFCQQIFKLKEIFSTIFLYATSFITTNHQNVDIWKEITGKKILEKALKIQQNRNKKLDFFLSIHILWNCSYSVSFFFFYCIPFEQIYFKRKNILFKFQYLCMQNKNSFDYVFKRTKFAQKYKIY